MSRQRADRPVGAVMSRLVPTPIRSAAMWECYRRDDVDVPAGMIVAAGVRWSLVAYRSAGARRPSSASFVRLAGLVMRVTKSLAAEEILVRYQSE